MADYALITGASGGIGEALAHLFAEDGVSLVLVARNAEQLERVRSEIVAAHDVVVIVGSYDLSEPTAVQQLYDWTQSQKITIRYLINNAGFGDRANVRDAELERLQSMVHLNIESLVTLSKLYGSDMANRKQGTIVNIASIAGFFPGPGMAVYYASKAFVLSFSQALAVELELHGVQVSAVCPGATKTGFAAAANAEKARIFSGTLPTAAQVAVFTYKAMKKGQLVAVWGRGNRLIIRVISLLPRRWLARTVRRIQ